jgi:hypothetical protein
MMVCRLKVDEGVSGREDGSRGPNKAPSKFQPDTCTTALCCIRRAFTAHPAFQRSVSLPPRSPLYYRFALKNPKITAPCPVAASTFTSVFVLVQGIGFWDKVQIVMCRARLGSKPRVRAQACSGCEPSPSGWLVSGSSLCLIGRKRCLHQVPTQRPVQVHHCHRDSETVIILRSSTMLSRFRHMDFDEKGHRRRYMGLPIRARE